MDYCIGVMDGYLQTLDDCVCISSNEGLGMVTSFENVVVHEFG